MPSATCIFLLFPLASSFSLAYGAAAGGVNLGPSAVPRLDYFSMANGAAAGGVNLGPSAVPWMDRRLRC